MDDCKSTAMAAFRNTLGGLDFVVGMSWTRFCNALAGRSLSDHDPVAWRQILVATLATILATPLIGYLFKLQNRFTREAKEARESGDMKTAYLKRVKARSTKTFMSWGVLYFVAEQIDAAILVLLPKRPWYWRGFDTLVLLVVAAALTVFVVQVAPRHHCFEVQSRHALGDVVQGGFTYLIALAFLATVSSAFGLEDVDDEDNGLKLLWWSLATVVATSIALVVLGIFDNQDMKGQKSEIKQKGGGKAEAEAGLTEGGDPEWDYLVERFWVRARALAAGAITLSASEVIFRFIYVAIMGDTPEHIGSGSRMRDAVALFAAGLLVAYVGSFIANYLKLRVQRQLEEELADDDEPMVDEFVEYLLEATQTALESMLQAFGFMAGRSLYAFVLVATYALMGNQLDSTSNIMRMLGRLLYAIVCTAIATLVNVYIPRTTPALPVTVVKDGEGKRAAGAAE